MEFKKGDKVAWGPFRGTVTRIGRRPGTKEFVWFMVEGYCDYAGGMDGEKPFEHVVKAKDLRLL